MTPGFVPEKFERVMGCTSADLLSWLPRALPAATLTVDTRNTNCTAKLPDGVLVLHWKTLPDTRIALLVLPRLAVCFEYSGLSAERRHEVQWRFDLGTQRGGG